MPNQEQNTVMSTENEWDGKESGEYRMLRSSKDLLENQDPGMGLLGVGEWGETTKLLKSHNKPDWRVYHPHSGPLVLNSQL